MTFGALAAAVAVTCALLAAMGPLAFRVRWSHPDAAALAAAGWRRGHLAWEGLRLASCVCCALGGTALGLGPGGGILGAFVPSVLTRVIADGARDRAMRESTRILRATHSAVRSGIAVPAALRRAIDASPDALARAPFDRALAAFSLGAPLDTALADAATRADAKTAVSLETLAIGVAERLSLERTAALTGALAERLEVEERLDDEVRARTSGARGQVVLLACLVPALALYLVVTVPGLIDSFASPMGRVLLVTAATLEIAGVGASRRIVRMAS